MLDTRDHLENSRAKYRLLHVIERGLVFDVYEAVLSDGSGADRVVTFQQLAPDLTSDETMQRRFRAGARWARTLRHENLVQVVDCGAADGSEFLVAERVDGLNARDAALRAREQGARVPVEVALFVVAQIARVLAYLDERRSSGEAPKHALPPLVAASHVQLGWSGSVKLADVGLPRRVGVEAMPDAASEVRRWLADPDDPFSRELDSDVREIVESGLSSIATGGIADFARHVSEVSARRAPEGGREVLCRWMEGLRDVPPKSKPARGDPFGWMVLPTGQSGRFTVQSEASPAPRVEVELQRTAAPSPSPRASTSAPADSADPASRRSQRAVVGWAWLLSVVGALALVAGAGLFLFGSRPARPPYRALSGKPVAGVGVGAMGWVRFGGPRLYHALVVVDGERVAHAPLELSLGVGTHRATYIVEGERFERVFHVASKHTRRSPLWRRE